MSKCDANNKHEMGHLVCLLAVLMLSLALEAICPVHVLRLVITAVDEHFCGVQPYVRLIRHIGSTGTKRLTLVSESEQDNLY